MESHGIEKSAWRLDVGSSSRVCRDSFMQRDFVTLFGLLAPTEDLPCFVGINVLAVNQLRRRSKGEAAAPKEGVIMLLSHLRRR